LGGKQRKTNCGIKFEIDLGGKTKENELWWNFLPLILNFNSSLSSIASSKTDYKRFALDKFWFQLGWNLPWMANNVFGWWATVTGWRFLHRLGKIVAGMIRCGFDGVCLIASNLVDMEC